MSIQRYSLDIPGHAILAYCRGTKKSATTNKPGIGGLTWLPEENCRDPMQVVSQAQVGLRLQVLKLGYQQLCRRGPRLCLRHLGHA